METVAMSALWQAPEDFDAAVAASPAIDRYCSASAWALPAHAAFHARAAPLVLRGASGWAALAGDVAASVGRYFAPLEAMWGLACPLVGPSPRHLAAEFTAAMLGRRAAWDTLWLSGIPLDGELFRALAQSMTRARLRVRVGPSAMRYAASLGGGLDGWLGRRSARFRANLRRASRQAAGDGIRFERVAPPADADPTAIYTRILDVEARSWKGVAEVGITHGAMRDFYAAALRLLIPRRALRLVVATHDGRDVGYVFGGTFGDTYRGLQVSFDDAYRERSLGNVLQAEMIAALCEEGLGAYDLGSEIAYKARWAEPGITTVSVVVLNR